MVIRWLERRSFFAISNGPTLRGSLVEGSRIKLICNRKRGGKKRRCFAVYTFARVDPDPGVLDSNKEIDSCFDGFFGCAFRPLD